jgi:hypothetical protein
MRSFGEDLKNVADELAAPPEPGDTTHWSYGRMLPSANGVCWCGPIYGPASLNVLATPGEATFLVTTKPSGSTVTMCRHGGRSVPYRAAR